MRPTDPGKLSIAVLSLLLCLCAGTVWAQQPAPASSNPARASEPVKDGAKPAPQKSDSFMTVDPGAGPAKPDIPGAQTVLLDENKKLPERKDSAYEDWTKPELTPGMKTQAVSLLKAERDGFTRELVSLQWRDIDPIDLWVIKPAGVEKPPVILYLYASPSNNARYKNDQFCQFLTKNGFAAVGFVSAVTGQRLHDRAMKDSFVNQLQEALATSTHDVQLILNYLAKRSDLDMSRVGMWGDGSGASIAILAAAVDSRIKAVDLLDPWGDWPEWLAKSSLVPEDERADLLKPGFLKMVENLDPVNYLPQLRTQQVRLQYIKSGLTVTSEVVRKRMEAAAPSNANIVHYENTKQFVADVGSKGIGFDWIKEQLGSMVAEHPGGGQSATRTSGDKSTDR